MLGKLLKSLAGNRAPEPARATKTPFVAFVTPGDALHRFSPEDRLGSSQASLRLRVQIPGREISRAVATYAIPIGMLLKGDLETLGAPLAIVIGKIGSDRLMSRESEARAILDWVARASPEQRIFADLSDHYAGMAVDLQSPFLAEYQHRLGRACAFTVPCEAMRHQVEGDAARGVHVIEDPWESPRANAPRAPRTDAPRLAWFGNLAKTTATVVERSLTDIARRFPRLPVHLQFLAQDARRDVANGLLSNIASQAPGWTIEFTPWSPAATWAAIDAADVVLLPQDTAGNWRSAKSHNRLVEAIRGGRIALASPIPSYVELESGAWVGEDLSEGLAWALAHPDEARARIAAGQAQVEARFSPAAIGDRWRRVLGAA